MPAVPENPVYEVSKCWELTTHGWLVKFLSR